MEKHTDQEKKDLLILIVDDVPKNIQILGNILSREGFQIAAATSGNQALEILKTISPDLILLDIMMPEIDGFEVCKKILKLKTCNDIPIIFITAKSEKEDIIKGFEAGGVDYITKPFNTLELLARVKTHIKLKDSIEVQKQLVAELQDALSEVKRLSGLLPICSNCKKIRDDNGYWNQVEEYVTSHSKVKFSHGICPDCLKELYPEYADKVMEINNNEK